MEITIGSNYFVSTNKELVESLFNPKGSASGLFKVRKGGILFSRPNGEAIAFLVANRWNERFFVSCSRREDGRLVYMHSTSELAERFLGIAGMSYSEQSEAAVNAWNAVCPDCACGDSLSANDWRELEDVTKGRGPDFP